MINKKKLLLTSKVSLFVLILLIIIAIIPLTISKYETTTRGNINSNIAFYLFHDDYIVQNVNLSNVDFSQGHYVLNFTVSNQNNNTTVERDDDGTYFQTFTMDEEELLYRTPKVNSYTLVVYFGNYYRNAKYQDMVESVRIIIDSKQVID